jgi:hypothetical protein
VSRLSRETHGEQVFDRGTADRSPPQQISSDRSFEKCRLTAGALGY